MAEMHKITPRTVLEMTEYVYHALAFLLFFKPNPLHFAKQPNFMMKVQVLLYSRPFAFYSSTRQRSLKKK